jgi:hypothetical protein
LNEHLAPVVSIVVMDIDAVPVALFGNGIGIMDVYRWVNQTYSPDMVCGYQYVFRIGVSDNEKSSNVGIIIIIKRYIFESVFRIGFRNEFRITIGISPQ